MERVLVDCFGASVGHLHWGWDLWWKNGGWRQADPPSSPQHLIWEDAERVLPCPPDVVFALVRDPVDRMVSEYRFQREKRRGSRFGRYLARLPFSLWLRLMLHLVRLNPYAFDNHLRPQSDFVPDGAAIFRLEDGMKPLGLWVAEQTGYPDNFPTEFPQHLSGTGVMPQISARDKGLIRKAFSKDCDRFGYTGQTGKQAARPLLDIIAWALAKPVFLLECRGRI